MNAARHTVSDERLLAYAAGALSAPEAVVVAAHLSFRPRTAAFARRLQAVGGHMLREIQPEPMGEHALAQVLARTEIDAGLTEPPLPLNDMSQLPELLRRLPLGPWRWMGPGVRVRDVHGPRDGDCRVILLEIKPGCTTPRHTHGGVELTCVLTGAYATETDRFDVGDLEEADHQTLHQPRVVSDEPCLCVAALDGQIQLDGWLGKLFQPFVRL